MRHESDIEAAPQLRVAASMDELRAGALSFNAGGASIRDRARALLRQSSYWIFDEETKRFGPSKYVGFANMTFDIYARALTAAAGGERFDGYRTRTAVEAILEDLAGQQAFLVSLSPLTTHTPPPTT